MDSSSSRPVKDGDASVSLGDKIFLALKTPKNEVYLNEKIPIKILLFVTGLSVEYNVVPQMDSVGFDIEDFGKPRQPIYFFKKKSCHMCTWWPGCGI